MCRYNKWFIVRSRRYDIGATTYRHMGELRELSEQRSYSRGGIVPVALSR